MKTLLMKVGYKVALFGAWLMNLAEPDPDTIHRPGSVTYVTRPEFTIHYDDEWLDELSIEFDDGTHIDLKADYE